MVIHTVNIKVAGTEKSGQIGTPVILVDDEMVIEFNQSKLDKLLSK